jgi:nucleotide-binding universal stress UspA family protein
MARGMVRGTVVSDRSEIVFVNVLVGGAGGDDGFALAKQLAAPRARILVAPGDRSVGRRLRRLIKAEQPDLLVIGLSGRGTLERGLLWSEVLATLNGGPCAVAIAPVGYAACGGGLGLIGVGYDGSRESERGLLVARELAGRYGARVKVLAVSSLQSIPYGESIPMSWLSREQRAVDAELARLGGFADAEDEVTYGEPREELVELSEHVDLLIVGSRGYGPLRRLVEGSVSSYLAERVRCPLLVLPGRARKKVEAEGSAVSRESHV